MNDKEYQEFRTSVLKLHGKRNHKVKGSLGVYDAYKYIRKNKWLNIPKRLTEHEFYSIIRTVNNYFAQEIIQGNDVIFPCKMGKLEVRKYNPKIKFQNGKLSSCLPIDWNATLKLWYEDKESFNKKKLIYETPDEIFKVIYSSYNANYNNKSFYSWYLNRDIKIKLKKKIKEGALEAFILT